MVTRWKSHVTFFFTRLALENLTKTTFSKNMNFFQKNDYAHCIYGVKRHVLANFCDQIPLRHLKKISCNWFRIIFRFFGTTQVSAVLSRKLFLQNVNANLYLYSVMNFSFLCKLSLSKILPLLFLANKTL